MALSKKEHGLLVVLIVLLIFGVGGSAVYEYAKGKSTALSSNNPTGQDMTNFEKQKKMLQAMEEKLKQNPGEVNLRLEMGNQYYDLASEMRGSDQGESTLLFNQAVGHYQEFLKSKTDISVLVDLATAAYYGKDYATADDAFKKAIGGDPKFYQARYNYGVFLFHAKEDLNGALREWKTALTLNPSPQDTQRLNNLISGLEKEIAASGKPTDASGIKQ